MPKIVCFVDRRQPILRAPDGEFSERFLMVSNLRVPCLSIAAGSIRILAPEWDFRRTACGFDRSVDRMEIDRQRADNPSDHVRFVCFGANGRAWNGCSEAS